MSMTSKIDQEIGSKSDNSDKKEFTKEFDFFNTQILWLFWKVYAGVCVSVIWEKREGLAKTVMGRSDHVSGFFSFSLPLFELEIRDATDTIKGPTI